MSSADEARDCIDLLDVLLGKRLRWMATDHLGRPTTNAQRTLAWLRDYGPGREEWPLLGDAFWLEGADRISDRVGVEIFGSPTMTANVRANSHRSLDTLDYHADHRLVAARCDYFARATGVPRPKDIHDRVKMLVWVEQMVVPLATRWELTRMGEDT